MPDSFTNKAKMFHISLGIAGTIRQSDERIEGILVDDNGRSLSANEVRHFLCNQRKENGYTVYAGCSNMDSRGYCQGHDKESSSPIDKNNYGGSNAK